MTGSFIALVALVGVTKPFAAEAKLNVFACVPEWGALAETLGGENVAITLATSAQDNPDSVKPSPAMIASLKEADIVACTGAGLEEAWLEPMIERSQNPKIAEGQPGHFMASHYVELLEDAHGGEEEGKEEGHLHEEGNPHIQNDPRNVQKVAAQLARLLIQLDPANKATYSDSAKAFIKRLGDVTTQLEKKAEPLRGINIASQHEHSVYLLEWLGIHNAATVEPEPGVPPGPAHLADIIKAVPAKQIKFVIYAPYEDPGPSEFIAGKTGIPLIKVPFTVGGTDGATDLVSLYEDAVSRLLDGLSGRERR